MERYTILLNWNTQCCQNDYTAPRQSTDSMQSLKLPMAFFTELEQKKLKVCMEKHKTLNSQSHPEKEK